MIMQRDFPSFPLQNSCQLFLLPVTENYSESKNIYKKILRHLFKNTNLLRQFVETNLLTSTTGK